MFKNNNKEAFNNTYLATAIKWAIRNEVRRRYKWYTLKNSRKSVIDDELDNNVREEVYKTILSIEEMQEAEVPTQIRALDNTPEENIELLKRIANNYEDLTEKTGPWNFLEKILEKYV